MFLFLLQFYEVKGIYIVGNLKDFGEMFISFCGNDVNQSCMKYNRLVGLGSVILIELDINQSSVRFWRGFKYEFYKILFFSYDFDKEMSFLNWFIFLVDRIYLVCFGKIRKFRLYIYLVKDRVIQ